MLKAGSALNDEITACSVTCMNGSLDPMMTESAVEQRVLCSLKGPHPF